MDLGTKTVGLRARPLAGRVLLAFCLCSFLSANDCSDLSDDCNGNAEADSCDIASGWSIDEDADGIPDECQTSGFAMSFAGPSSLRLGRVGRFVEDYDCLLIPGPDFETDTVGEVGGKVGWSLSVVAQGVTITDATTDGTLLDQDFGASIFELTELTTGEGNEGVIAAVASGHVARIVLPTTHPSVVLRFRVEGNTETFVDGTLEGGESGGRARVGLSYRDGLVGTGQPVSNSMIWHGEPHTPMLTSKSIPVSVGANAFVRGDATGSGQIDISDSIFILNYLFIGGAEPSCLDAADTDDSGSLDLTDGHLINLFLFLGGPAPAEPGPFVGCGEDETDDTLRCAAFSACI